MSSLGDSNYRLRQSSGHFGRLEGVVFSPLFGCEAVFETKGCGEVYARRCAEYFENLRADSSEYIEEIIEACASYVLDLIEENDFDLGEDFDFDEDSPAEEVLRLLHPQKIIFERFDSLTDDDCPAAFSIKVSLKAVPDEVFELAMRESAAVYVGEYRGVSPWNDALLKKKYNYIG